MMTKKQKKMVARLGISAVCLIQGIVAEEVIPWTGLCFWLLIWLPGMISP